MPEQDSQHLRRIVVTGFKSIKELDLEIRPINLLIGANGSGKSNFVSLFTFLSNLCEGKLRYYVEKQGFASAFFHFGVKRTKQICIEIYVGINSYHVVFEHSAHDDALVFKEEYCKIASSNWKYQLQSRQGESGFVQPKSRRSLYVAQYTETYLEQCRVYHFHDTSAGAGFKQASKLSANCYLNSDASNIAPFLYCLKNSDESSFTKSYFKIVATIQTVAPFFHDFYLEPTVGTGENQILLKWVHRDQSFPFSANQLSDGTARFICLATLFLQPDELLPETIVVDEPELGLHPVALEVLSEIIKSTSKRKQVICSTQSITLANMFDVGDFIIVDQSSGVSEFNRIDEEKYKEWLKEYSVGDLWNKNVIGGRPDW